jgi:DNA-binding transcriptional MerR regulator
VTSAPQVAEPESPNQLTIEQLAAQSGMTVRNIRAHQARGLLDPPEVRARVGYYGPEHLEQLRLIRDLQEEGFNLGGIKRLLDDTQGTAERLRRFRQTLSAAATPEQGEVMTLEELGRRFRVSAQEAPEVLAEAERLGMLVPIGDGRFQAPSPSLLAIAEEIVGRGISLRSALSVLEDIDRHCESVSRSFVELFLHEIWKPFAQADMPAEGWPEMEQAVQRLGPVASEALIAIFQRRLSTEIDGAFTEIARRLAERTPDDGDRAE